MISFLQKTFGDTSEKRIKKYAKLVEEINTLEPLVVKLSDDELKAKTFEFKDRLSNGQTIDDIKVEAFAIVREATKRVLGMRHFDVQLMGGLVLAEGNIPEMATGEGKTLVASLPSYLRALEGKGVHVITVNDYLARRDRDQIGQIHEFLGLTVGLNLPMMETDEKQRAYRADITYGIGTEFGFDYLRDNMARDINEQVQRPFHYAIIDEIDSVLIDEAKTPLIIAGKSGSSANLHYIAAKLAKRFKKEVDFDFDPETKATSLTDTGIEKVEKAFGVDNLYDLEHQVLFHYVIQAVRAHVMFHCDVDYIVRDGKVFLVDSFTGRIMDGRSLSDGLHQAIEAKEGLAITDENKTMAQVTIQNYFRMYPILSGMTGTAKTEEKEFQQVYGMDVIPIPTNRPKIREDMPDLVFNTQEEKYQNVVNEVKRRHETGQPILIGTTSILQSETVAEYLTKERLSFQVLNAKNVEKEAQLIANAGQKGQITIATNMAGRGTDIHLGENVADLGGLHVIGTEKHESRRVDNQLRGRAGRQGDPGSSQFFLSLEDEMLLRFANDDLKKLSKKIKSSEDGLVTNKNIQDFIEKTQIMVEGINYSIREYNLKLDDVMNDQRNVIYKLRNKVIMGNDTLNILRNAVDQTVTRLVDATCSDEILVEEWELDKLKTILNKIFGEEISFPEEINSKIDIHQTIQPIMDHFTETLDQDKDNTEMMETMKQIMVNIIDHFWVRHLDNMTILKEGIGLRSYQQEDPMRLYQKEGLDIFIETYNTIEKEIAIESGLYLKSMKQ